MSDAAALTASAPAATGPVAPVHEAYLPPNGDAAYLSNPRPAYPPLAQKRGWEGVVTLFVAVDENGQPQEVKVKETSGYPVLDRCAVEAVQRWRFVPAKRGGRAVAANVEVPIRFGLEERSTG
jgi:protein TonB